jgi:integrase
MVIARLHIGFRTSELLSLTWEDVDFHRQTITIKATYAKNGESRSGPMNDILTATFQGVRMSSGPMFCSRNSTLYRPFGRPLNMPSAGQ